MWSYARPSDDPTALGYNIPQNVQLERVLGQIVVLMRARRPSDDPAHQNKLANNAEKIQNEVRQGIRSYGIAEVPAEYSPGQQQTLLEGLRGVYSARGTQGREHASRVAEFMRRKVDTEKRTKGDAEIHTTKDGRGKDEAMAEEEGFPKKFMYAYEVDGWGNQILMDDANMPNLLGLPLLPGAATSGGSHHHAEEEQALYRNTREYVLSLGNPNYFFLPQGGPPPRDGTSSSLHRTDGAVPAGGGADTFRGLGSRHESHGLRAAPPVNDDTMGMAGNDRWWECYSGCIWPLGLVAEGWTATSVHEKSRIMHDLLKSDGGTHLLYEGFDPSNVEKRNRDSFGWANSLFARWVLEEWV